MHGFVPHRLTTTFENHVVQQKALFPEHEVNMDFLGNSAVASP